MAVVFDISGPIGMFRRPYTTTSSVSFPVPPPTSVAGLISAILGFDNGSNDEASKALYWENIKGTKVAVAITRPLAWSTGTINFWNMKEPQKNIHIRVKHQFVKNPGYRIYVSGGVEGKLQELLENGRFIYTPYLGTAYALADIQYCGSFPEVLVQSGKMALSTVIPQLEGTRIDFDIKNTGGVFRERLPYALSAERAFQESINVFYSSDPSQNITLSGWEGLDVSTVGDENVAWFPAWQ
ncbi:MAG: type I-B CRISPR-associated protein Cas5b [Firmicutes bacterium]|nr:type I-B CRISPR-associated protein Cas5b [Bacillota bacterium]